MTTTGLIITLLLVWAHFVADFLLQSDSMALNKSRSDITLACHCALYAIPFLFGGWLFALMAGAAHFIVDRATSRICARYYAAGNRHMFFVTIGADQAIHFTVLFGLAFWLL